MCDNFPSLETCIGQGREIACRLQSTRDSANPEFDVVEGCLPPELEGVQGYVDPDNCLLGCGIITLPALRAAQR